MLKVEYLEIDRVSVEELNKLGEEGWKPAAIKFEEGYWDKMAQDYDDSGWSGLLYRERAEV